MPKITIGIPVYNGEATLEETLHSCAKLPESLFKIVVSDNCSVDQTYEIAQRYAKNQMNVSVIRHEKNLGASNNFRFLLDECETEYFMWLAGDDVITTLDWNEVENCFSNYPDAIAVAPVAWVYDKSKIVQDRGNGELVDSKIKNLLSYVLRPGANSRFYSIYKTAPLKKLYYEMWGTTGSDYFASDVEFSASVVLKGMWPLEKSFEITRKPGVSSDGWKIRKAYAKNFLGAIFPSMRFIKGTVSRVHAFHKIPVLGLLLLLYIRFLVGPVRHRLSMLMARGT